jgi:beta-mannosidase
MCKKLIQFLPSNPECETEFTTIFKRFIEWFDFFGGPYIHKGGTEKNGIFTIQNSGKMSKSLLFLAISIGCILLFHHPLSAQDMNKIDLGGIWKFQQAGGTKWSEGTVPGCVHLDLMKNGIISDPFYRDNEKYIQWIGNTGWEYKKTIMVSDTFFKYRHIELVCTGLDTYANVYLNDSLIIRADNMFMDWYANIHNYLKVGANTFRIQFPAITVENKSRYDKLPYKLPGDDKVVCRKAAYHFGWDWGPTLITSGIWKPLYIRYWNYVNVRSIQYIQKKLTDSAASLTAVFIVTADVSDTGLFRILEHNNLLVSEKVSLSKGVNVVRLDFTIQNPKRWWTNGLGDPYLYPFTHRVIFGNRIVGEGTTRIGLRTVQLVQQRDSVGRGFYFKVNGVPVFMKGANYIPQDNFPARVKDSSYRELIGSAAAANMNMLRVWGGGIYEKDIFYNLCDEYGILVWQDFMFANAMYPGTKDFMKSVQGEAVQNIVHLRNHPCLAVWCGNNEIEEGWKNWGWPKDYKYTNEDSTSIWQNYLTIFGSALPTAVSKFDTLRPYINSSPRFGWGQKESLTTGDMHYWGVWWGKSPFESYKKNVGRFMSEYGFQGFPALTTIGKVTLPGDRDLKSPVLKSHQKHPTGFEIIDEYMKREYQVPVNFESYGYVSQLLQAEGMKTAIEAHRRAKPFCMGTLFWQFNDCWPVISWSCRDYYGNKKASYYWLKNEYATVLVSSTIENGNFRVFIVSDSLQQITAQLELKLVDFYGKVLLNKSLPVLIQPNSSKIFFDNRVSAILGSQNSSNLVMIMKVTAGGKILARNLEYFVSPKDLLLETPSITRTVHEAENGYVIRLSSDKLAKNVFITSTLKGDFSDNYFDLLPNESLVIEFRTNMRSGNFAQSLKFRTLADTYSK